MNDERKINSESLFEEEITKLIVAWGTEDNKLEDKVQRLKSDPRDIRNYLLNRIKDCAAKAYINHAREFRSDRSGCWSGNIHPVVIDALENNFLMRFKSLFDKSIINVTYTPSLNLICIIAICCALRKAIRYSDWREFVEVLDLIEKSNDMHLYFILLFVYEDIFERKIF